MGDERRFTEEEANAILGRAVDLERIGASNPCTLGRGIWELVARTTAGKTEILADEIASAAVDLGTPTPLPAEDGYQRAQQWGQRDPSCTTLGRRLIVPCLSRHIGDCRFE